MGLRMDTSALDRARAARQNTLDMRAQRAAAGNANIAKLNEMRRQESLGMGWPEVQRDNWAGDHGYGDWGGFVQNINSQMPGAQGPERPDDPLYYETDYTQFSDNVRGLDPIAKYAGPSAFAQAQYGDMERYGLGQEARAASRARQEAARGAGTARNALAMRGGATGGALERLGAGANRASTAAVGDIYARGVQDRLGGRLNLAKSDWEAQRQDAQRKAEFDYRREGDIYDRYAQEVGRQNLFNMERYKTQMGEYGAGKTADAQKTAAENSGGTWFCTIALSHAEDRKRLRRAIDTLRELAEKYDPEAHEFYLKNGRFPASRMGIADVQFVYDVRDLIEDKKYEEAFELYRSEALKCFKKYSPEIDVTAFERGEK